MFVSPQKYLEDGRERKYAVPHFNTSDLESTQAIIEAAVELNSPVILATSSSAIKYAGLKRISALARIYGEQVDIPVALHLDHGPDLTLVKKCLGAGYTSVMMDGSYLPFKKNIAITKKVVKLAHKRKVAVEAELGKLEGIEDDVKVKKGEGHLTDPDQALDFVKQTGVDSLAIAIGTSHGAYKFKGKSRLDFKRLKKIADIVDIPLVLHGASSVPARLVRLANRYGAEIENARGVSEADLKKAIELGISKINTDTDLRLAFTAAIRETLAKNKKEFNPRTILESAIEEMKQIAKEKIILFNSKNKSF